MTLEDTMTTMNYLLPYGISQGFAACTRLSEIMLDMGVRIETPCGGPDSRIDCLRHEDFL